MPIFLILFFILLMLLGPYFTISSLNLLFGLEIPVTIWTYLAVIWLGIVLAPKNTSS